MRVARRFVFGLFQVFLSILITLVGIELVLWFFPVANSIVLPQPPAIVTFPHHRTNADFVYSRGWTFELSNRGRTNNFGFVNDQDYDPADGRPLTILIGDSYVEALMVPFPQTAMGRMQRTVGGTRRVYSIGMSGAPLSQYLWWVKYACDLFKPKLLVISVVGNDFDESFLRYKMKSGGAAPFTYFELTKAGEPTYRTVVYKQSHASPLHKLASTLGLGNLAIVRYVRTNAPNLEHQLSVLFQNWNVQLGVTTLDARPSPRFVGNVPARVPDTRLKDAQMAVDLFFSELARKSCLPPDRVALTVDGMRQGIYNPALAEAFQSSYFGRMRNYFLTQARSRGYFAIDLHDAFARDFSREHRKFEFPTDGHWSAYGHKIVAEEIMRWPQFRIWSGN